MWIVICLIIFVSGVLSTLLAVHFLLKRYMQMCREYQESKEKHQRNFRELINRVYHKDQIPRAKRIRGLANLGLPATSKLLDWQSEILSTLIRLLNQVSLLSKANHHGYAKFALEETEAAITNLRLCLQQTESIREYWTLTQQVSLEHEENVIKTVKEFEHYQ